MLRPVIAVVTSCLLVSPGAGAAQTCAEPHYRWSEKIDTAFAARPAARVEITTILTGWAPRSLTSKDICAPRAGREDSVFVVSGWARRVQLHEADGDTHMELTQAASSPVTSCVIVEIPADRYGVAYRHARTALAALVDTTRLSQRGDLDPPVAVQVTGLPFFDGWHQQVPAAGGPSRATQHGRCNSSLRALWEIHPVYKVEAPGP